MGLGAVFVNQLVKFDAKAQEDLDKILIKAKEANERRYFGKLPFHSPLLFPSSAPKIYLLLLRPWIVINASYRTIPFPFGIASFIVHSIYCANLIWAGNLGIQLHS